MYVQYNLSIYLFIHPQTRHANYTIFKLTYAWSHLIELLVKAGKSELSTYLYTYLLPVFANSGWVASQWLSREWVSGKTAVGNAWTGSREASPPGGAGSHREAIRGREAPKPRSSNQTPSPESTLSSDWPAYSTPNSSTSSRPRASANSTACPTVTRCQPETISVPGYVHRVIVTCALHVHTSPETHTSQCTCTASPEYPAVACTKTASTVSYSANAVAKSNTAVVSSCAADSVMCVN